LYQAGTKHDRGKHAVMYTNYKIVANIMTKIIQDNVHVT